MPLFKYKTHEDAQKALWNFNPDNNYYVRVSNLFQIAFHLAPPVSERGVHCFKTIEEAQVHRLKNVSRHKE